MSASVSINGTSYTSPTNGDTDYAATFSALLSALCAAGSTVVDLGIASGLLAATTYYAGPGNNGGGPTELMWRAPIGGKLSKLYAVSTSAFTGDSCVITVRKGSTSTTSATSITCTIAASGTTASDTSNTATVAAGDYLSVSVTPGASYSSGGANLRITILFTPS